MILTSKQEEGLRIATRRFFTREPYTCIAGYAGSGKSTLVQFIVQELELDPYEVAYISYTGKAAKVLTQKGCPNAITAHKLLYYANQGKDGKYYFKPKPRLEGNFRLIVVDEVSMLPSDMWDLLLSHKIHVLACGDPGQLPPINPKDDNHVLDKPHIFLDEIMRQAQDSEIIRLSMHIREGKPLHTFPCANAEVKIIRPQEITSGMYQWADQVICATNNTRHDINKLIRQLNGRDGDPQVGDKVISLKNHWFELSNENLTPLTNGTIGTITDVSNYEYYLPPGIHTNPKMPALTLSMVDEDGDSYEDMILDYNALVNGKKYLSDKQEYYLAKKALVPYEFSYGYAITCWKAQGSEWGKVLGIEESFPFDKETHKRYLYTMATRASNKLVLVRKN